LQLVLDGMIAPNLARIKRGFQKLWINCSDAVPNRAFTDFAFDSSRDPEQQPKHGDAKGVSAR
jgi:hypothetical protein